MILKTWKPSENGGTAYMVGVERREPWRIRAVVDRGGVTVYASWQGSWYETNAATIGPRKYAEIERLARLCDFTA